MNAHEMVLGIIIVVTIGSVLRARYGIQRTRGRRNAYQPDPVESAENARLQEEVRSLKERIQVLERVITDNNSSSMRLDAEIEKLRDNNRV